MQQAMHAVWCYGTGSSPSLSWQQAPNARTGCPLAGRLCPWRFSTPSWCRGYVLLHRWWVPGAGALCSRSPFRQATAACRVACSVNVSVGTPTATTTGAVANLNLAVTDTGTAPVSVPWSLTLVNPAYTVVTQVGAAQLLTACCQAQAMPAAAPGVWPQEAQPPLSHADAPGHKRTSRGCPAQTGFRV